MSFIIPGNFKHTLNNPLLQGIIFYLIIRTDIRRRDMRPKLLPVYRVSIEVFADGMRKKMSGDVSFIDGELIVIDGQEIAVGDIPGIF